MFGLDVRFIKVMTVVAIIVTLVACSNSRYSMRHDAAPKGEFDFSNVPDAKPKWEPLSRQGNASTYRVRGKDYRVMPSAEGYAEIGVASWYGLKFHGELTSNGETYNMYEMSAAHKTLPLPTYLKVTNLENSKSVIVRVNDRGPFHSDRIIDLSFAAANRLGFADKGTAKVKIEAITVAKASKPIVPVSAVVTNQSGSTSNKSQPKDRLAPFVQVAAFSQRPAAERLAKKLSSDLSYGKVFVAESLKSGKAIHRVRMGPFDSEAEAVAMRKRVEHLGVGEPIVITRSILAAHR